MKDKIQQENNIAKGDVIAGSKTVMSLTYKKTIINNNKSPYDIKKKHIQEHELNNEVIEENVKKINNYLLPIEDSGLTKNLEEKLTDAQMADLITKALLLKEKAFKMCADNVFNLRYIKDTSYCLSRIVTRFERKIPPLILLNRDRIEIENKTLEDVIEYISDLYPIFDSQDVTGMLYMLAGNCHIKWVP